MAASWGDIVIDPSRLRAERPSPRSWRDIPIVEPKQIATEGLRWVAVRTAVKSERSVAAELVAHGYAAYCPLGAKFVYWHDGKRSKHKVVKQFPVFGRYIFVGLRSRQSINKYVTTGKYLEEDGFGGYRVAGSRMVSIRGIESVLGDGWGPLLIPFEAIRELNAREVDHQWNETKRSPWRGDENFRILNGPFRDFYATFDSEVSESRIRAMVKMFGRETSVELDVSDVEVV